MKTPIVILTTLLLISPPIIMSRSPPEDVLNSDSILDSIQVEEDKEPSSSLSEVNPTRSVREVVVDLFQETFLSLMDALSKTLSDLSARSRFRRDLNSSSSPLDEDTDYIFHSLSVGVGAFMDKQSCRRRLTCQATKIVKRNVPGLEMFVMLMDNVIPDSWVDWFSTIKSSAVDRSDRCSVDYDCDILPND